MLSRELEGVKSLLHAVLEGQREIRHALASRMASTESSTPATSSQDQDPDPPTQSLRLGRPWPRDFVTVSKMKLQGLVVRYVRDDLATVAMSQSNRLHKEVQLAITVMSQFADLHSIWIAASSDEVLGDPLGFSTKMYAFTRSGQERVVSFIAQRRAASGTAQRKRSINGSVSGVVRAWGALNNEEKMLVNQGARVVLFIRFMHCFLVLGAASSIWNWWESNPLPAWLTQ